MWVYQFSDLDGVVPNLMLFDLNRNRDSHLIQSRSKNVEALKRLKTVAVDFMQELERSKVFPDLLETGMGIETAVVRCNFGF